MTPFLYSELPIAALLLQRLLLLLKVLIIVKLNTKLQGHFTHIINIKKVLHGSRSQLRYHRERQSYDMRNGADCGEAKQISQLSYSSSLDRNCRDTELSCGTNNYIIEKFRVVALICRKIHVCGQGQSGQAIKLFQVPRKVCFTFHF